jgi:uncharacterized repeat protein (TIGR01451 family)
VLRKLLPYVCVLLFLPSLLADVSVTDRKAAIRLVSVSEHAKLTPAEKQAIRDANAAKKAAKVAARKLHLRGGMTSQTAHVKLTPAEKQAIRDANKAKHAAKVAARHKLHLRGGVSASEVHAMSTGSISLVDSSGLQYFINTDITFSTSSSASGAASEASYTGPVVASTSGGGTTTSTLNDSFDGYNSICISLTNATGTCRTGDANYNLYRGNGPAAFDATVPATPECTNRQVAEPAQTIGPLSVSRKIFVPTNDQFIRWMDIVTNTSGAPVTFTLATGNNLGSDSNTRIVSSSSGDNVATVADTWVSTFQNFSGNTSSDPRLGHVLQGAGAPTPLAAINFADGDDNPWWVYSITLAPGQTKSILNFATGQGTKAAANAKAAALAALPASATQCMSNTELNQVTNFAVSTDLSITKVTSTPSVNLGGTCTYTLQVTNNGPTTASNVTVTDVLPPGATYLNDSGTGWSCNQVAGTITCTLPSLAVGPAAPITLSTTAPASTTGPLNNQATVTSGTLDPTPGNNASAVAVVNVVASSAVSIVKSTSAVQAYSGQPVTYSLAVSNAGPTSALSVSVTDVLPAGATFVSAAGTGWSCGQAAGTVTCTMAVLPVGAAPAISLVFTAPPTATATTLSNTATVGGTGITPGPTTSSTKVIPLLPASAIPLFDPMHLALMAIALATAAVVVMKRNA